MEDQLLFVAEDLPPHFADALCMGDAPEVRERLRAMLDKMRAALSWPWNSSSVSDYRERVWPSLLARLPDAGEAARLLREFEDEASRLDDVATFRLG